MLMPRGFRTCMAKGGRESLRPSYSRRKLTLVPRYSRINNLSIEHRIYSNLSIPIYFDHSLFSIRETCQSWKTSKVGTPFYSITFKILNSQAPKQSSKEIKTPNPPSKPEDGGKCGD